MKRALAVMDFVFTTANVSFCSLPTPVLRLVHLGGLARQDHYAFYETRQDSSLKG